MTSEEQRISLSPDSPVQSEALGISYDFGDLALTETTLKVTWDPSSLPSSQHTVTPEDNSVTIKVPSTATAIRIEDCDGPSPDLHANVVPGEQERAAEA